jgi:ABC-type cobalamin/Fe3+-siderophores transport system ATPase subunit
MQSTFQIGAEMFSVLYTTDLYRILPLILSPIVSVVIVQYQMGIYNKESVNLNEGIYFGILSLCATLCATGLNNTVLWYLMDKRSNEFKKDLLMGQLHSGVFIPNKNRKRIVKAANHIFNMMCIFQIPLNYYKSIMSAVVSMYFLPTMWHIFVTIIAFMFTWIIVKYIGKLFSKKLTDIPVVFDPTNPDGYTEEREKKENLTTIKDLSDIGEVNSRLTLGHTISANLDGDDPDKDMVRYAKYIVNTLVIDAASTLIFIILLNTSTRAIAQSISSFCWMISLSAENSVKLRKIYYFHEYMFLTKRLNDQRHDCLRSRGDDTLRTIKISGVTGYDNIINDVTFYSVSFTYNDDILTQTNNHTNCCAIKDLNYVFSKGKLYYITGVNGAGKSSLFKAMIYNLESGRILFDGIDRDDYEWGQLHRAIYYLNQANESPALLNSDIVDDLKMQNSKLAKQLGLDEIDGVCSNGKSGSGGQEQRLHIFVALASRASIVLLDEPFSALDIEWRNKIEDVLIEQSRNRIIILVGHDCYSEKKHLINALTLISWRDTVGNEIGVTKLVKS